MSPAATTCAYGWWMAPPTASPYNLSWRIPYALGINTGLRRLYVSFAPEPDDPDPRQVLVYRSRREPSLLTAVLVGHGGTDGGGGIAVNAVTNHVFVSNSAEDSVTVFDGTTNMLLATVQSVTILSRCCGSGIELRLGGKSEKQHRERCAGLVLSRGKPKAENWRDTNGEFNGRIHVGRVVARRSYRSVEVSYDAHLETLAQAFLPVAVRQPIPATAAGLRNPVPADLQVFEAQADEAAHHGLGGVASSVPAHHQKTRPQRLDSSLERQ